MKCHDIDIFQVGHGDRMPREHWIQESWRQSSGTEKGYLREIQWRRRLRSAQALRKAQTSSHLSRYVLNSACVSAHRSAGTERPAAGRIVVTISCCQGKRNSQRPCLPYESGMDASLTWRVPVLPFGNLLFAVRAGGCAGCCWGAPKPAGIPRIF